MGFNECFSLLRDTTAFISVILMRKRVNIIGIICYDSCIPQFMSRPLWDLKLFASNRVISVHISFSDSNFEYSPAWKTKHFYIASIPLGDFPNWFVNWIKVSRLMCELFIICRRFWFNKAPKRQTVWLGWIQGCKTFCVGVFFSFQIIGTDSAYQADSEDIFDFTWTHAILTPVIVWISELLIYVKSLPEDAQMPTQKFKNWILRYSSQEIGSSLVPLEMIFEALQSKRFKLTYWVRKFLKSRTSTLVWFMY